VAEDYITPPLVAVEPTSPRAARWRFRIVLSLAFLVVIGGLALLLFTVILSNSEGNPGLNPQGLAPLTGGASAGRSTVATVPPPGAGSSVS
jgi:hypothetical protein